MMVTDDWYPTLAKPGVRLDHRRCQTDHADRDRRGRRCRAPADVLVLATGFQSHDFVAPMEIRGVDGSTRSPTSGQRRRKPIWALSVPAFSEHVPAVRPEHERRNRVRSSSRWRRECAMCSPPSPNWIAPSSTAHRGSPRRRRRVSPRGQKSPGGYGLDRLRQLVSRRERTQSQPVAVDLGNVCAPDAAIGARRLPGGSRAGSGCIFDAVAG